jgi:hypothetical protein
MFKKNKAKVLSQVKNSEFDEVVLKIQELFRRNGMTISVENIKNYKDWIFVDDGEKVVAAAVIYEIGSFAGMNFFMLSRFTAMSYRQTKLSLREHRKAISDLFEKAVEFSKNSKEIDYLVQGVNHFSVHSSIRAGFNADLLEDPDVAEVVQALVAAVRYIDSCIGILDPIEDPESYKVDCLNAIAVAIANVGSTKSKTDHRKHRALRKNREFVDKNPANLAYYGLILGIKTK